MYVCVYAHASVYVCTFDICIYVPNRYKVSYGRQERMYVCMFIYVCMYVYMYLRGVYTCIGICLCIECVGIFSKMLVYLVHPGDDRMR